MFENTTNVDSRVNRQQVENILKRFLEKSNLKVLALNGEWGVGKTYLVYKTLSEKKKGYYSASVFGLTSIDQLKARLLLSFKKPPINENQSLLNKTESETRFGNNLLYKPIIYIQKLWERFINSITSNPEQVSRINLGNIKEQDLTFLFSGTIISLVTAIGLNLAFDKVKGSIICIDDIERKSKLHLDELLGFVEYLVQELECKIILIYNEDFLDEESKKVLNEYREKVIDIQVTLKPTVEENLFLVFDKDNADVDIIKQVFERSETNNIRLIIKIKWVIDEVLGLITNWEHGLYNQVIKNIIVITLARLDNKFSNRFSINLKTILSLIDSSKYLDRDNDNFDKELQAINFLSYLGYNPLELDIQIIDLVQTSLFSTDEFIRKGNILNEREMRKQILEKFNNVYEPYYSSFRASEEEIASRIKNFLEDYHLDLYISEIEKFENLASVVNLDLSPYKKSLLKNIINNFKFNSFQDLEFLKKKLFEFPDLQICLEEKLSKEQQHQNITKSLTNLLSDTVDELWYREKDIYFLNNCTVEEYYKWLKEDNPDLVSMVRYCLKMGNIASDRLREAIVKLAKESPLNAMRAKFLYEIILDEA